MNHPLRRLQELLKWPLRRLLAIPALRSSVAFELRQRYFNELECKLPIGDGLACPIQFWEASSSLGHIFFEGEYARAFDNIPLPRRWLDIGCYAGYFSLYVAWRRQLEGQVGRGEAFLVDADSRTVAAVEELLRVNQLAGKWSFHRGAIARESERPRFVERSFMTSSLESIVGDSEDIVEVPVISAADILRMFPPPYDLVKVDIEGGEYGFLLEYADILTQTKFLLIEWHAWHPGGGGESQIRSMSEERGFTFVSEVLAPIDAGHRTGAQSSGVHLYRRANELSDA
jgi:FkbM family methyltransferase